MKKIFSILALALVAMTASAIEVPTYSLNKADGAEAHGTIKFYVGTDLTTAVTKAAEGATVTMIITPNGGWVVNTDKVKGLWIAAEARAPRRVAMAKDIALTHVSTDATTNAVTYTFTMIRANAEISCAYKKLLTSPDISVDDIPEQTYSGQPLTPAVTVKDGTTELVKGTDYTVSYSTNSNAGTGTVTITAVSTSEKYTGTTTKDFVILQAEGRVFFSPKKFTKKFGDPDFTIEPEVIGDATPIYKSNDGTVATVNTITGEVSIKGVGKALIEAILPATANFTSARDFYHLIVEPKDIAYEGGSVTQDENGYTVNMTEDANNPSADPLPDDADLSNLTYGRELTAPGNEPGGDGSGDIVIDEKPANMYTVCLPFAPKKDAALKYYTLTGVSGETLHFDEVADAQSHTPYLVAVFGDVNITEDCSNLDVTSMTINSKTVDGYTFNGTFTGKKNADALGLYILQRKMQWGKVTSGSVYLPPFRAFIEAPATSASQLTGIVGDGNATGIDRIVTTDLDGTERWYDLSGRRIATPAKGIYINNGRKVVVK